MELQPSHKEILEYLDKHGSVNTFRLSKDLKRDRNKLINLIEELINEGLASFRSGTVTKGDKKLITQEMTRGTEVDKEKAGREKAIPKQIPAQKTLKKPKKLKERQFQVEKVKEKIQGLEDNWLNKREKLKKEIEDFQIQKERITQKLAKENALLYQIRKERKETEKNLALWEQSLSQREKAIQKKEKLIFAATEEERLKKRKIKLKAVPKETQKLKKAQEKKQKKTEGYKIRKEESKIDKIVVSKTENKKPEIITKESWQPAIEISKEDIESKFHNLIEQEISLLKQKRISEVRDIHLKIKDMISEVSDINQVKRIIKDWNRIKDFY